MALKPKINLTFKVLLVALTLASIFAYKASASTYGSSGTYGSCQFGSCSISISSSGTVNLDITPTLSGSCTIQSDTVSVLTDDTNGYTLGIANNSTNTALTSGGNSVSATSGTFASPIALTVNSWGYRVDGIGSFGAGPTTAQSNISPPSTKFAATPASNATADTLANTSVAADPAVDTSVWYGVCADSSTASGSYTATVVYTATTN